MLKYSYPSAAEVPAEHKAFYRQDADGTMTLDVDETPASKKVAEFRGNNTKLLQERDATIKELNAAKALLDKYKGIDPEKAQEAAQTLQRLQEKQLIDAGEFEKVLAMRTQSIVTDRDTQLKAKTDAYNAMEARERKYYAELSRERVDNAVLAAARRAGNLVPGAEFDVISRARTVFSMDENGKIAANKDAADAFNEKGEPISVDEYATRLIKQSAHLFVGAQGGGAQGTSSRSAPRGQADGDRTPRKLSASEFGKHMDDIISGKVVATALSGLEG